MNQAETVSPAATASNTYTYYAFISYKREDEYWARWLKRQLQHYRLPAKTHKQHRELPRRCSPIFLDKTNLVPGELDSGLSNEVQSSKYLIVICSRAAKANSRYLDAELKYFLEGGGSISRVIPLIVEKSSHPVEECFPEYLADLCSEKNIVGVSIYDDGKRTALLRIISAMLGIKREELESDDSRRRKRTVSAVTAVTFLILSAIIAVISVAWHRTALSEQRYKTALANTYLYQGSERSREGNYEEAQLFFSEALSAAPENRAAWLAAYLTLRGRTWPVLTEHTVAKGGQDHADDLAYTPANFDPAWGKLIYTSPGPSFTGSYHSGWKKRVSDLRASLRRRL